MFAIIIYFFLFFHPLFLLIFLFSFYFCTLFNRGFSPQSYNLTHVFVSTYFVIELCFWYFFWNNALSSFYYFPYLALHILNDFCFHESKAEKAFDNTTWLSANLLMALKLIFYSKKQWKNIRNKKDFHLNKEPISQFWFCEILLIPFFNSFSSHSLLCSFQWKILE